MRLFKFVVPVAIIAAIVWFVPEVRLAALAIAGRTKGCPFSETVRSASNMRRQAEFNDRIVRTSRLVQKDGNFHLWDTPRGRYWVPAGSDYSLTWDLAEQERKIYGTGKFAVSSGDTVLDCGANVGVYTREALNSGAALVVAIELAPENLECLRRTFVNGVAAGRVIIYPKGVWDKEGTLQLNVDPGNSAADSLVMHPEKSYKGPVVPVTTIDNLVAELKLSRVDYIKMDIEGAEPNALIGGRQTLAKFHPRMALSAYHAPDHPKLIPELVHKAWAGYRVECGPCADSKTFVRPDVLYFY